MSEKMTEALIEDVRRMVSEGRVLLHPCQGLWFNTRKAGAFIWRNKVEIANVGAQMVVAGLLTGGIGAAVVPVVYAGTALAKGVYSWGQSAWAESSLNALMASGASATQLMPSARGDDAPMIRVVDLSVEVAEMHKHIAMLARNENLGTIVSCFEELDDDAAALAEKTSGPMVTHPPTSCDEAWLLVELLERVEMRLVMLGEACDQLFHFVHYSMLVTSGFDHPSEIYSFEPRRARAVASLIRLCGSPEAALEAMNVAANSGRVFHNRLRGLSMFGLSLDDHRPWVRAHNPELALAGTTVTSMAAHEPRGVGGTAAMTAGLKAITTPGGLGASATGHVIINQAKGATLTDGIITSSAGLAGGALPAVAAGAIAGGANAAIDVVAKSLQRYIDLKTLRKIQERLKAGLKPNGDDTRLEDVRPLLEILTFIDHEAVRNLRKHAGDILKTCSEKLLHLVEADAEFNGVLNRAHNAQELAEILARRQKLEDQVNGLMPLLYTFYECTAGRAIGLQQAARAVRTPIHQAVRTWLDSHPARPCDHSHHVCYMDAFDAWPAETEGLEMDDWDQARAAQLSWQDQPVHPGDDGSGGLRERVAWYSMM